MLRLESMDDDPRSGRPSTSTYNAYVTKVNEIVRSNKHLIVRETAEDGNISVSTCHIILIEKLEMHRIAAKFVPRLMA